MHRRWRDNSSNSRNTLRGRRHYNSSNSRNTLRGRVALELHVSQAVQEEVLFPSSVLQLLQEEDQVFSDFRGAPQEEDVRHERVFATTPLRTLLQA